MKYYLINLVAGKLSSTEERPAEEDTSLLVFDNTEEPLRALTGPQLVEVHNIIVRSRPELAAREVNRFADTKAAVRRTWGLLARLRGIDDGTEPVEAPAKKKAPKKQAVAPKKEKAPALKKEKTQVKPKVKRAEGEERALADKEVPRAAKIYPIRPGSMQEHAFNLISRSGGIDVDDFVREMNAKKRAKYTRGNAWSALVYILHVNKGYGVRRRAGRFYLIK